MSESPNQLKAAYTWPLIGITTSLLILLVILVILDGSKVLLESVFSLLSLSAAVLAYLAVKSAFESGRRGYESQRRNIEEKLHELEGENAELQRKYESELARYTPAARFESERKQASNSSRWDFITGVVIVAVVVGVGLIEWVDSVSGTARVLNTPDALARIAVVGAAFYLAGQLFKRSARLKTQAMEFQRAAIAMEVTDSVAELIKGDSDQILLMRAEFRRSVYEYHLKGPTASDVTESGDFMVHAVEALNKVRGSQ